MKYIPLIAALAFFLQGYGISRAEMVQEPNAFGKDLDGIVEGLKARGFSCGDEGKSNSEIASSTIFCGNEKLTLLCREKVFLYLVVITFDSSTRKITSLSRTNCF